jgi:SAM-dependent methyltransferase
MKRTIKKALRIIRTPLVQLGQVYYNATGSKFECNTCNHKTNTFKSNPWHQYSVCPHCTSNVRQRLLAASLQYLEAFRFDTIISDKRVLHFAPEPPIRKLIKGKARDYKTADFFAEGYAYDHIDYNLDISSMQTIPNESFDCVIACDVLEHVPDHIGGIREVYRILSKGGCCIFTVPQKDFLKTTFEDGTVTDPDERERIYGQRDHLRIYGDDFVDMMQAAGFDVTAVDEHYFEEKLRTRHVLAPPVLSKHPLATNYRKVFFGRKV